jgi:hypothetical protein
MRGQDLLGIQVIFDSGFPIGTLGNDKEGIAKIFDLVLGTMFFVIK